MSDKKLITLLIFTLLNLPIYGNVSLTLDQKRAEEVETGLRTAKASEDSIKILYDVYDLSDRDKKKDVGFKILNIAQRTNNREVTLDILSRLALKVEDTEALSRLMEISNSLPADSSKRGLDLLLEMEVATQEAKKDNGTLRNQKFVEYAQADLMTDKLDIYEEILTLYRAMVYLGMSSQGSLYLEYLTRLQDLVSKLPEDDFAIRNLVLSTASIYYTRNEDYPKALEASRVLKQQIEKLKEKFPPSERQYQTFDYFRYMINRRMLENYKGMSRDEAQKLYEECVEIAANNEEVASILGSRGLTESYYNMAMHNYKEAIPHLYKALSNDDLSLFRQQELLGHLIEALDSVGNKTAMFDAMKKYVNLMKEYKRAHLEDAHNELQLRTDVNRLAFEEKMEARKQQEENRNMRKVSITLVYVLGILLIIMCGAYFRALNKVKILQRQNRGLSSNLEQIFDDGTPRGTHDARLERGRLKG